MQHDCSDGVCVCVCEAQTCICMCGLCWCSVCLCALLKSSVNTADFWSIFGIDGCVTVHSIVRGSQRHTHTHTHTLIQLHVYSDKHLGLDFDIKGKVCRNFYSIISNFNQEFWIVTRFVIVYKHCPLSVISLSHNIFSQNWTSSLSLIFGNKVNFENCIHFLKLLILAPSLANPKC